MDNNKIIHLYIISQCGNDCPLCCNKQYDIDQIPVVTVEELQYADTLCITGGEPFFLPYLDKWIKGIRKQYPNIKHLYVYTSGHSFATWIQNHLGPIRLKDCGIDGINFSPKDDYDVKYLKMVFENQYILQELVLLDSNRIYLFPDIDKSAFEHLRKYNSFKLIDREWQEEFQPHSGIFRRLPLLF